MSDLTPLLAIAAGAVPGALARFHLTEWTKAKFGTKFPYGTFMINLSGCLAMGFFFTLAQDIAGFPKDLDLLIRTGFLGSFTTFSTYGFDTLTLWRNQERTLTCIYWAGSAILGLIAVMAGISMAQFLVL